MSLTIQQIYNRYPITPNLARHMLRVAAVARLIVRNWKGPEINGELITRIALLHDTGNILKFDLDGHSELLDEEQGNVEHWKALQKEAREKYGSDEHHMTLEIAEECGYSDDELAIMAGMGFGKSDEIADSPNYHRKIINYADQRVGPFGVLSLVERLDEARKRYENHPHKNRDWSRTALLIQCIQQIESQIIQHCSIKSEDITDDAIRDDVEVLRSYVI